MITVSPGRSLAQGAAQHPAVRQAGERVDGGVYSKTRRLIGEFEGSLGVTYEDREVTFEEHPGNAQAWSRRQDRLAHPERQVHRKSVVGRSKGRDRHPAEVLDKVPSHRGGVSRGLDPQQRTGRVEHDGQRHVSAQGHRWMLIGGIAIADRLLRRHWPPGMVRPSFSHGLTLRKKRRSPQTYLFRDAPSHNAPLTVTRSTGP